MKSTTPQAKTPLILRYHRLMDAFAKSDDERDFYLDKVEGFILYADLDKGLEELEILEKELLTNAARYALLPKMTFYEVKKFMEGFVHEKVYDIDTKEKLLDLISAKEARENFLEFIYDHLTELEKWQLYYQERSRIRIIEWLRQQNIHFVFEEDLELPKNIVEKVKRTLFDAKVPKDVNQARDMLSAKAKTYYSNEALNPRPKRGRPPKQVAKVELEPQMTVDIYTQVPSACRTFLYIPDIASAASVTFSSKFETEEHLLASLRGSPRLRVDEKLEALSQRLESLRHLSDRLAGAEKMFGDDKGRKPFQPFIKPKFKDTKSIEIMREEAAPKIDLATEGILPKKRGRPRKDDQAEEFAPQKRRRFAIKKVTQIKSKKDK
ncbi:MAG: hypothetical protein COT85_05570 [Chlamydiae bacterium CG10_big_fil_rev_8_21_14_0_10_42_34]|nr:MAG: hypothetical protein COT85_05570 [Chlamydiae bacterium CG10_big_fil_rev_8_21_14_0_10_42_34]